MYDIGDIVPLTIELRDTSGVLANAGGTVTLTIGLPDATSITPTVTNSATGRYQCDYTPPQAGRYSVRWVATGTNSAAYSDQFDVRATDSGSIVSLAEMKSFLNMSSDKTDEDEELRNYIDAGTQVIEQYRNEIIFRRIITERVSIATGAYTKRLTLSNSPVLEVLTVSQVGTTKTWLVASLDVDTTRGRITAPDYFYGEIVVTYYAGYRSVPANFRLAAQIVIAHLWGLQRRASIGGRGVFGGTETDATPSGFGYAIPNRAAELLGGQPPVIA